MANLCSLAIAGRLQLHRFQKIEFGETLVRFRHQNSFPKNATRDVGLKRPRITGKLSQKRHLCGLLWPSWAKNSKQRLIAASGDFVTERRSSVETNPLLNGLITGRPSI
jgi:hypothetical protein